MNSEKNTSRTSLTIPLGEEPYYKLVEEAAKRQVEPDEYAQTVLLEELGFDEAEGLPDSFGQFVVERQDISGTKRQRNVRRVTNTLYQILREHADKQGGSLSDHLDHTTYTQAITNATDDLAETEGKDHDTYRGTVRRNCTTGIGFSGEQEFCETVGELAEEYHVKITQSNKSD